MSIEKDIEMLKSRVEALENTSPHFQKLKEKQEPKCEHDKSVYWEKDLVNPESFPSRYERYFKKELPTCPFCPKKENKKLVSMEDVIRKLDIVLSKDAPLSHKIKTALLELL